MNNFFRPAFSRIALITVLGFLSAAPLYAATFTWTGATNTFWNTGTNWAPPGPPGSNDDLVFAGTTRVVNTNNIDSGNVTFDSITFSSGAGAFVLNGNTVFLGGGNLPFGNTVVGGLVNNSTNLETLNFTVADVFFPQYNGIILNNSMTWNAAAGPLLITSTTVTANGALSGGFVNSVVTLTITGAFNTTITSLIEDDPGTAPFGVATFAMIKNGTGTLELDNNNTFSGGLTINNGTVDVGAPFALGAGFTTLNVGTLETVGGLPLAFNVGTNFTMAANGAADILRMKVGGLTSGINTDFLHVGNVMNLAGELFVHKIFNFMPAPGDQVTIITSGGARNGTFQIVASDFPGLIQPIAIYFPQRVDVRFVLSPFTSLPGLCFNEFSVAEALDKAFASACLPLSTFTFLGNIPVADVPDVLDLIAPEELAAIYEISFSQATVQNSNLMRRMDDIRAGANGFCAAGYAPPPATTYTKDAGGKGSLEKNPAPAWVPAPENRWGIFISGGGDFVHVGEKNDECAPGYDLRIGNITVGADYRVFENLAIGIYGGYAGADADLVGDGRLNLANGNGGGFATFFWHGFYVDASGGGGWNNYDIHRRALSPRGTLGLTAGPWANGSTDGDEVNAMGAIGYDWKHDFGKPGCLTMGPLVSIQYTNVDINGYTEHGSFLPLVIQDQSDDSVRLTAGGRVSLDVRSEHGVIFRPEVRASWLHEFNDRAYPIDARFVGCPDIFTVHGPDVGRDAALVGAGVTIQVTPTFAVFGHYDGIVGRDNYNSFAVNGGLSFGF